MSWLAYRSITDYSSAVRARRQAQQSVARLKAFQSLLIDAETGQRGFLLTGQVEYLGPYQAAGAQWKTALAELQQDAQSRPDMRPQLVQLAELTEAKLAELQQTVALRRADEPGSEEAIQTILASGDGRRIMDRLRGLIATMTLDQDNEQAEASARVTRNAGRSLTAILLLGTLSVLLVGAVSIVGSRERRFRQVAADEVRQQRVVLSAVLNSLTDGVIVVDESGRLVRFNPAAEAMHGGRGASDKPPAEWSEHYGLYLTDMVTPIPEAKLPLVRALQGESFTYLDLFQRLHGETEGHFFACSGGPIVDEDGRNRGAVIVLRDITQERAAAERLKQSEEAYRDLYDLAPCGYYAIDGDSLVVSMNATALSWLGYKREEVVGKLHIVDLLAPEDRLAFLDRFAKFKVQGHTEGVLQIFQRRDGSHFPTLLNAAAVYDRDGRFLRTRTTIFDLTERRSAEKKFQGLLESAPDAIVMVDQRGVIQLVNTQTERLFGYPRLQMLGQQVEMLLPDRYRAGHPMQRDGFFANPRIRAMGAGVDLHGLRADGREIPIEISLSPVENEAEMWACAAIRDVTEYRRMLEQVRDLNDALEERVSQRTAELAHANAELTHRNQENEMFVFSVSHDLRSPLVNLQGFSHELASSCAELKQLASAPETPPALRDRVCAIIDSDIQESIHFIRTSVQRLSGIIDALLRLSRAGRVVYEWQQINTQAMVERVVDSLRSTIAQHQARVEVQTLPWSWGDSTAVELVFANLLSNALNYLDAQRAGEVSVGVIPAAHDDAFQTYFVRDNGVGIPGELQGKIFTAFQRLTPNLAVGEGMGLTLAQRIVERHGGRLWVESQPGSGTTFYFTLPSSPVSDARAVAELLEEGERL
ncbi:MAG TPA: PAS domain S-box protein [Pirellulaceae bacterium]|nr:PAS domain S-box protein [Pirellulaceae bacterium]